MKKISAFFYPDPDNAPEQKNGYIGKAAIIIADAVRLNGASVFVNEADGTYSIKLPQHTFIGSDDKEVVLNRVSPKGPEGYAMMVAAVAKAVENEKHFGFVPGTYLHGKPGEGMEVVKGELVNEPYADGRFEVAVADVCILHGITTKPVDYKKDNGKPGHFVAVDKPVISEYEASDGEKRYRPAFEGLVRTGTNQKDEEYAIDYGRMLDNLVKAKRRELIQERKPALNDQMKDAEGKKNEAAAHEAPAKEQSR